MALNYELVKSFISKNASDNYFILLKELEFLPLRLKVRGKFFTPARKCLAYSENGLTYSFSGATIHPLPWTELLLDIKHQVEERCGEKFNFALLNYYPDGTSGIGAHRDNEKELEVQASIACVSFGATRKLIFQKKEQNDVVLELEHGSLLIMSPPTNRMFTHAIPPQPEVKEPRISITFRRMKDPATTRPAKRARENDLPENDWLTEFVAKEEKSSRKFDLGSDVFACVCYYNNNVKVHIRKYIASEKPTKTGVCMCPTTWFYFMDNLFKFNSIYTSGSKVVNNSVLMLSSEGNMFLSEIQNCAPFQTNGKNITLTEEQICALKENVQQISESVFELMIKLQVPSQMKNIVRHCTYLTVVEINNFTEKTAKLLRTNISQNIRPHFICNGCIITHPSQRRHDCLNFTEEEQIATLGTFYYLLINVQELSEHFSNLNELFDLELFERLDMPHIFTLMSDSSSNM